MKPFAIKDLSSENVFLITGCREQGGVLRLPFGTVTAKLRLLK